MNYLTHLYFSSDCIDNTRGLIIANTAKEHHLSKYNLEILKGIAIDMQINNFKENHTAFKRSMQRIHSRYISFAPFLVNMFYDHLLAKNWDNYSSVNLGMFSMKIYSAILEHRSTYPYKIRKFAPRMIKLDWINNITNLEGTHQYINSVAHNEGFTKNLDQGLSELTENYQHFKNDFEEYFSDLRKFMKVEAERFNSIKDENQFFLLSA